ANKTKAGKYKIDHRKRRQTTGPFLFAHCSLLYFNSLTGFSSVASLPSLFLNLCYFFRFYSYIYEIFYVLSKMNFGRYVIEKRGRL
ncbi:MAG: hypothetical protein ACYSU5_18260, partial [Planctomycetota bacterium]